MIIGGSRLYDKNFVFRLLAIIFAGIMTLAVATTWRAKALFVADIPDISATDIPLHSQTLRDKETEINQPDTQQIYDENQTSN